MQVTGHKPGPTPMVKVSDLSGEPIMGSFYPYELQQIDWNPLRDRTIERVISTRRHGGRKQNLLKFNEYPPNYKEWVDDLAS